MKRILIFTILIQFILIILSSSNIAESFNPKFTVLTKIIKLGRIKASQVVEHFLLFKNDGDADLVIDSIVTNCPCTSFQILSKDKTYQIWQSETNIIIAPGDKIKVKLIFNSSKTTHVGVFKRMILIHSNDPVMPEKRIRVMGEIKS